MLRQSIFTILRVWDKAQTIEGYNPEVWRQDFAGAWIRKDAYGQHTKYGWVIDHLTPTSKGGTNEYDNLVALHWQNNRTKAADYPIFKTILSADGNRNIKKEKRWQLQSK